MKERVKLACLEDLNYYTFIVSSKGPGETVSTLSLLRESLTCVQTTMAWTRLWD